VGGENFEPALNRSHTGIMNSRLTNIWILLGLLTMLTIPLTTLVWPAPARADGHPTVLAMCEAETSSALLEARVSATPSFFNNHLMATATYTSYLPIITNVSPAEPLDTLIMLINTERQKLGVPPLRLNPILMQVAQTYSQIMGEQGFFDHTDPITGTSPCERIASAGYALLACAENIAAGYPTAQAVFQAWMNSPRHRANLLSSDFMEVGVGYAEGGYYHYYWTVDLACPR